MKLVNSKRALLLFLMKSIQVLILFNSSLIVMGVHYSYLVIVSVFLSLSLIWGLRSTSVSRYVVHIFYVILLNIVCLIQFVYIDLDVTKILAVGLYIMPILCWVVFYSRYSKVDFEQYFVFSFKLSILISFLGIIQYLFSPQLFGLIPNKSFSIQWASGLAFSEYASFFRATSTLGSPQVFGLYCSLMIVIGYRYRRNISPYVLNAGLGVLLLGGMLSGNKLFFLIVCIYFIGGVLPTLISKMGGAFFILVILSTLALTLPFVTHKIPMLDRIFSVESMVVQESSDSRLDRYVYIVKNTDPLLGNGLGSITNKRHGELRAAESYILKIYYEAGAIALIGLLLLMCHILHQSLAFKKSDTLIIVCIFISMLVVHAFESPVFFIIWGYILSMNSVRRSGEH